MILSFLLSLVFSAEVGSIEFFRGDLWDYAANYNLRFAQQTTEKCVAETFWGTVGSRQVLVEELFRHSPEAEISFTKTGEPQEINCKLSNCGPGVWGVLLTSSIRDLNHFDRILDGMLAAFKDRSRVIPDDCFTPSGFLRLPCPSEGQEFTVIFIMQCADGKTHCVSASDGAQATLLAQARCTIATMAERQASLLAEIAKLQTQLAQAPEENCKPQAFKTVEALPAAPETSAEQRAATNDAAQVALLEARTNSENAPPSKICVAS